MKCRTVNSVIITCLTLFFTLFCTACLSTKITDPGLDPGINRLISSAQKEISVKITSKIAADESIGNQYLLFIPFGSIKSGNSEQLVSNILMEQLSLLGFKPKLRFDNSYAELNIQINQITLTAYDYIFSRKIYTKIDISAFLLTPDGNLAKQSNRTSSNSYYKKFAFRPELEYSLSKVTQENIKLILGDLFPTQSN